MTLNHLESLDVLIYRALQVSLCQRNSLGIFFDLSMETNNSTKYFDIWQQETLMYL